MTKFFLLFLSLIPCLAHGDISSSPTSRFVEVKSIHDVAGDVLYDPSDLWVILDLDDTILEGGESLTQYLWFRKTVEGFQQLGLSEQEAWDTSYSYWEDFQKKGSVKIVEKSMPIFISKLQEQNRILFVYTERKQSSKSLTLKQLETLNLSFSQTSPLLPNKLPNNISFESGILFGEEIHKGPALQYFLDLFPKLPQKIIYIDNHKENVLRIGELCKMKKISYLGVTYTAQKFSPPIYIPEISKVQYTFVNKLLSNEAAALLLRHKMTE